MNENQLAQLFRRYNHAFNHFSIPEMLECCTLPCVLHTPDKIAYLSNESEFVDEFTSIFQLLQGADVVNLCAKKSSYTEINTHLYIVSIHWALLDRNNDVYTEFSAFYHVSVQNEVFKITNVISHELENAVELAHVLILNET